MRILISTIALGFGLLAIGCTTPMTNSGLEAELAALRADTAAARAAAEAAAADARSANAAAQAAAARAASSEALALDASDRADRVFSRSLQK